MDRDGTFNAITIENVQFSLNNNVSAVAGQETDGQLSTTGLGSGGLFSFDKISTDYKLKVVKDDVRMLADLIYYQNGKAEKDQKEMMMKDGFKKVYTEFRNVQTSISGSTVDSYGKYNETEIVRLIGFSNEILRNHHHGQVPRRNTKQRTI